jgi:hypothetical protein
MQRTGQNGIRLNALAGIQQQIKEDNAFYGTDFQIVTSETIVMEKTVQASESHSGLWSRRVYVYEPGKPIWYYENP